MNRWIKFIGFASVSTIALACGRGPNDSQGELTVQGSVSSAVQVDNARAVAIGSDGRQFWTYLDRDRDFTLTLPVGQSYRIVIANQLAGGGQQKVGHLVLRDVDGKTEWLGANEAGTVDLGRLRPAKDTTTRTLCSECSSGSDDDKDEADDKDDHDDDKDEKADKDDDDDDDCNVCKGDDEDKELEPSKHPGGKCEDKEKNKGKHGGKGGSGDDEKPCPKKGSGGGEVNKPDEGGSGTKPEGDGATPPDGGGSKSEGSPCKQTSECSSVCSCVASKCETK